MKLSFEFLSLRFSCGFIAAAISLLLTVPVMAVEPFIIKDIRVEGLQRTEAGTVFSYLPMRIGETFSDEKGTAAIKALYATGFFKDVRIEIENDVLVVKIEERPIVSSIDFVGIQQFDKDQLIKALKESGLAEARPYDKSLMERAEQELKRQYLAKGFYSIKITTTVTPIERNRVGIQFSVKEGTISRISQINIVGNKAFSESDLLSELKLRTPNWFSWYTKNDQYSKEKLTADIETLKSFYLNRGYIEMQVESTQVSITPDKKDIYLTINITEGEKYTVSDIKLEGEMFGRQEELMTLVQLKKGEAFSNEKLSASIQKIFERMGDFGYAFANINPNPLLDRQKKEVAIMLLIDPNKRVYVRRINISGNTKTRDEVIRREFRQFENSWYDGDKIRLSRDRVDRLGYFNDVSVDTPEVPGTNDQIDLNMTVVEKPTGNIMLGAGFSSSDKLTLSGSIQQTNAFGSGDTIGVDINTSERNRTISLSRTNPYFTEDGISLSFETFLRTTRPPEVDSSDYRVKTLGANTRFGVPFSELDTIFFGFGIERTGVDTYLDEDGNNTSPSVYQDFVKIYGDGVTAKATGLPLTASWQRDSRDSAIVPSKGRFQRVYLELSPGADLRYYRGIYQHQYYYPFTKNITLALNGELDYGHGIKGRSYPIFKNFYGGGIGSVRGYESSSLGPRDTNGDPVGGSSRVIANAELQFPFPGSGSDRTLRWFTFFDAGNVFGEQENIKVSGLKYSTGVGLSWISPIGPLKLSYGKALNIKPTDRTQTFQFQLGTGF